MNSLYSLIKSKASELEGYSVKLRRYFHQNPELSLEEYKTASKIAEILSQFGIDVKTVAEGRGVIGLLKCKGDGKTVALRADTDALPIQEENQVPYKSKVPGVMHACGHDAHIAMLLTAAKILVEFKDKLNGNVKFIFQPAEEVGEGAKMMIRDGALENVDFIMGIHVWGSLDVGKIGLRSGAFMASGDFFEVIVKGSGGHGASPHLTRDPITASTAIINNIQTIISREIDPLNSAVISVTKIHGGEAYNVIPEKVSFGGTIRTLKEEVRRKIHERFTEMITEVSKAYRCEAEVKVMEKFAVTINDPSMIALIRRISVELVGEDNVIEHPPVMGSEDFSYYVQKVPGAFIPLGVRNEEKGIKYPHHHPRFNIDEDALPIGSALYASTAIALLREE